MVIVTIPGMAGGLRVRGSLRRRARARGAAVLLVVAALAALMAIALFAARSAMLKAASSGHARQATQTQYMTGYALTAVVAELSTQRGPAYVTRARLAPSSECAGGPGVDCFVFGREQLESLGGPLLDAPAAPLPGSLGWSDLDWASRIELTDAMPAMPPPPGYDETSAGAVDVRPVMVTLTATGVVWPRAGAGADPAEVVAVTASQAMLSAHVVISNVPKP